MSARLLVTAATIALLISTAACSYSVEFVIANKGDSEFWVTYRAYDPRWDGPGCPDFERVAPRQFEWRKRKTAERAAFPEESVRYSSKTCRLTVLLESGMAASVGAWRGGDLNPSKLGPINLKSRHGSVTYTGDEFLARIKRKSTTLWVFIHKPAHMAV